MTRFFALLLVVLMLGSFVTVAFANDSPVGSKEHTIDVTHEYPSGNENEPTVTAGDNDTYTLTAKEKDGYVFTGFEFDGVEGKDYEIVSKDGNTWVIKAKSDLKIRVHYRGNAPVTKPSEKPVDNKPTSPKTGDNTAVIFAMMLVAMCGVAVAAKKLSHN